MGTCMSEDVLIKEKDIVHYCPNCSNNYRNNVYMLESDKSNEESETLYADVLVGKKLKSAETFILSNKVYDNERTENLIKCIVVYKQNGQRIDADRKIKHDQRNILFVATNNNIITKYRKTPFSNGRINK